LQELSYDAWGRLRDPETQALYAIGEEPELLLGRGYTSHEHLLEFGLINMNARLYDPVLGRFLSPDPFVQDPLLGQNFNRYTYALNNPLRYTDPNGEFFWTIINGVKDLLVNTLIRPWSEGWNAWSNSSNWHSTTMAWKVDIGLYQGNFKQILSRFTWELPQTFVGYVTAGTLVTVNAVKNVSHWGGATAVETYSSGWGGFTLGSYITGGRGLNADPHNTLFQHEYGHYLQSQEYGWNYLFKVGLPSLISANGNDNHKYQSFEQDANRRAFKYFNKHVDGFYESTVDPSLYSGKGWNFRANPLNTKGDGQGNYVDYKDADDYALSQFAAGNSQCDGLCNGLGRKSCFCCSLGTARSRAL
jgi:RHS repeat-associated protein